MRKVSEEYFDKFEKKIIFYANIKQELISLKEFYANESLVFDENLRCFKSKYQKYLESIGISSESEIGFESFFGYVEKSLKEGLTHLIQNISNRGHSREFMKKKKIINFGGNYGKK